MISFSRHKKVLISPLVLLEHSFIFELPPVDNATQSKQTTTNVSRKIVRSNSNAARGSRRLCHQRIRKRVRKQSPYPRTDLCECCYIAHLQKIRDQFAVHENGHRSRKKISSPGQVATRQRPRYRKC